MDENKSVADSESKAITDDDYDPSLAYRILEEDFQQLLQDMNRVDRLGRFSSEFQKLMDAYKESHEKERELVDRNKSLHVQIAANASKVAAALKLSQADQETITKLKQEIEGAWRMVDAAHTREQLANEALENLRQQNSRLTQEMEASKKMGADQEQEAGALAKNKEAMAREKERIMNEAATAKNKLANALKFQDELEKKNDAAEERISELSTELEAQKNEWAKEKRFKEKLEEEVKELHAELASKEQDIQNQGTQLMNNGKHIFKLENSVRDQKASNERLHRELQEMTNSQRLTKIEYEQQVANVEKLQGDIVKKNQEFKLKEDEIARMKVDIGKINKTKEHLEKKIMILENQRANLEEEKAKLASIIVNLDKEISVGKKQAVSDRKMMDGLSREKDAITKSAQKATAFSQEQQKLIALQELHKKKLQEELHTHSESLEKQSKELTSLKNEKDRLVAESVELNNKVQDFVEDIKLKQMELYDYKKRIADTDAKMKIHMTLFEQVRTERNQLSKGLVEAQDEINELKHKLKVKSYQVEQLKEDITTKENQLLKEEYALQKLTKEKEGVRMELQKAHNELRECKERISLLTEEESRLQKIIQEADKDRARLNKEINQVSNERDILGTQLVRRNDELALLYEKVKILQCTLHKGEAQYDQRLEDIRLLKIEIKRLRQEKAMLARSMNNLADLRQEIFHLERDFTRERLKCRALEEELQNPLNVHRWRKLEGSDPTTYELIQKIQILQKRLLSSSEEAIKRESQLKETERLYLNLRQLLSRQPGPETLEKLKKTQNALRERGVKMKCLVAELTMYENQVIEYKFEMEQITKEMTDLKKKYFELKRREQKVKEKEKEVAREKKFLPMLEPITGSNAKSKFVGGGFNISPPVQRPPPIISNA